MILIQAQALDNRSADQFVLDGTAVEQGDERLAEALRQASDVQRHGELYDGDATRVIDHSSTVSVVIHTHQNDTGGRRAPIVATFPEALLQNSGVLSVVGAIAQAAHAIDRSFDEDVLSADLRRWLNRPKGLRAVWAGSPAVLQCLVRWLATPVRRAYRHSPLR